MAAIRFNRCWPSLLLCLLLSSSAQAVHFLDDEPVKPVQRTLMQWSHGNGFGGGAADRDSPLIGDRPDFVESAVTVGLGVLQMEIGYTFIYDNDGSQSVRSHGYPEALFRYGIWKEWFELRLMFSFLEEETVSGGTSSWLRGSEDIYLGAKIAIAPQEGLLPQTGILINMVVPSGSANVSDGEVLPGVSLVYSWELENGWELAGQTQGNRALDSTTGNAYTEFSQAVTMAISLNDRIGYYAEWFCLIPSGAETMQPEHYLDSGFTFLVHNDLQLDFRGGIGLGDAAADYFFGTGLIRRF
ncbi:MAG: transporter [Pirellulaceae bacterium]